MNSKELVKSVLTLSFLGLLAWVLFKIKLGLLYILIALILTLIINPLNKFFKCKFKINNTLSSILSISILISFFSLVIGLFVPILSKQGKNLSLLNTNEFREKFESTRVSILKYFESQNITIEEISAEEHDMMAARSQGLTHFVGRVIDDFGTNQTRIDTEGYKALHELVSQTCNDSWELFEDIQNFNPYTEKMISELNGSFKKISEIIEK